MLKGFFVTGTDTGIGKTIISGALIKVLNYLGIRTGAMKPIETGCGREGEVLIPYDGMFLKQFAHMAEPITQIVPCCLESPLAPLMAAEVDKVRPDTDEIRKAFLALYGKYDSLIVEGVGGLMVPVREDYYTIDIARDFGLPLIVVARPGLGTINHIMLTVNYAMKEGLKVAGIVINYGQMPDNSLAEQTNPKLLAQICPVPVIGIFPYMRIINEENVERAAIKNLDTELIKRFF